LILRIEENNVLKIFERFPVFFYLIEIVDLEMPERYAKLARSLDLGLDLSC
jgi:hypothetical protein